MVAANNTDVIMAADGSGSFIFPEFQPVADAMMAMVKLLESLARHRVRFSEVVAGLPTFQVHSTTVPCSWESKGAVMRRLQQEFAEFDIQVLDGIKVFFNEWEWVLARPDPDRPLFHIAAEAQTSVRSEEIMETHAQLVGRLAQNRLCLLYTSRCPQCPRATPRWSSGSGPPSNCHLRSNPRSC